MNKFPENCQFSALHLGKGYWPERGGMETALKQIAEIGLLMGHRVECWVSCGWCGASLDESVFGVLVKRWSSWGKWFSTPLSLGWFTEVSKLFGRRNRGVRDVIHMHLPNPLVEAAWVIFRKVFRAGAPGAFVPYFHAFPTSQGRLGKVWYAQVTRPLLRDAERILISSPGMVELFPVLREFEDKLRVVPFFTRALELPRLQEAWQKRLTSGHVVSIGRLVAYKGYADLVRAWSLLPRKIREKFTLEIVGEGPERGTLLDLIHSLGLQGQVSLKGALSDEERDRVLESALLFVAPSRTVAETFGISILEAMGAGLPVVTTDLPGGVAVLARGGECGAVFPRGDARALVLSLEQLLESPERCQKAGLLNHAFVSERFSMKAAAESYRSMLEEL